MHARMTVAQARPDRFDEAVTAIRETFLPAARERPGYQGFLILTNRDTGQLVGISAWDTEDNLAASGGGGGYYQQQMANFVGYLTEPPVTTTHEVAVSEW